MKQYALMVKQLVEKAVSGIPGDDEFIDMIIGGLKALKREQRAEAPEE